MISFNGLSVNYKNVYLAMYVKTFVDDIKLR